LALDVDGAKLRHRAFNITSSKAYSLKEVKDIIKNLIPKAEIELGPGIVKEWDSATGPISNVRAREELGYKPRYDLRKGFEEIIKWNKNL
jgi:nucleoside-diphosphate-sugar epimerase